MKLRDVFGVATPMVLAIVSILPALAEMGTIQATSGSQVNVRDMPSTTAQIRHYGLPGDRVNILNQTNAPDGFRWYYVEFPNSGARGWIRGDFLRTGANSTQRISFAPGTSAATVSGTVQGSESRDYLLGARAGQRMTVSTTSNTPFLQIQMFNPDGSIFYAGSRNWSGVLPRSGEYRIRMRIVPEEQNSGVRGQYNLTVAVR